MRTLLILIFISIGLTFSSGSYAQVDSARLSKTEKKIEREKKEVEKMDRKIAKEEKRMKKQEREIEKREKRKAKQNKENPQARAATGEDKERYY